MTRQKKEIRVPRTKPLGYVKRIGRRGMNVIKRIGEKNYKKKYGLKINGRRIPFGKLRAKPPHIRPSIEAGKILILVSSIHRGKRVICLGILPSGLLLVTGPYKINGVPLRRVNPAYVIATSTKIDISDIDISKFNDKYFVESKEEKKERMKKKKTESESLFISQGQKDTSKLPQEKKDDQKVIDKQIMLKIKDKILIQYLKARFTLRNNMFPHKMKF